MRALRTDRGNALIMTLAVLFLVFSVALTFMSVTRLERTAAANVVEQSRADLLARGGIELAISRLTTQLEDRAILELPSPTPVNAANPQNQAFAWYFGGATLEGPGDGIDLADATVLFPSFRRSAAPVATSILASTYAQDGDTNLVKVIDVSSQISLNVERTTVERMLTALGVQLQARFGTNPVPAATITTLLDTRDAQPGGIFTTKGQVRAAIGDAAFALLVDYVSVHALNHPSPVVPEPTNTYPRDHDDSLTDRRVPVNVNTAPIPVLVACIEGLQGNAIVGVELGPALRADNGGPTQVIRFLYQDTGAVTAAQALAIATAIDTRRRTLGPFNTRRELNEFLEAEGTNQAINPDLLIANFDPDLVPNSYHQDNARRFTVDAGNLTQPSVPFSLAPEGLFEIDSIGRVQDGDGLIIAEARRRRVLRLFVTLRHETQAEFEAGRVAMDDRLKTVPEPIDILGVADASRAAGAVSWGPPLNVDFNAEIFRVDFTDGFDTALPAGLPPNTDMDNPPTRLEDGGELGPHGVLAYPEVGDNEPGVRELSYASTAFVDLQEGAVDFWVKLGTDVQDGSDESILYIKRFDDTIPPQPIGGLNITQTGTAWKLVRYGDTLVSSRFYWGFPDESVSPVDLIFSERVHDISSWRAGEWHHIAHTWRNVIEQELFVDGVRSVLAFNFEGIVPGGGDNGGDLIRLFRLRSNDPTEEVHVGGYNFINPQNSNIFRTHLFLEGEINRMSHTIVDDVRIYDDPDNFPDVGFAPIDRFEATTPATFQGAFDLPQGLTGSLDGGEFRFGTIAWDTSHPEQLGDFANGQAVVDLDETDTPITMTVQMEGGAPIVLDADEIDGRGGGPLRGDGARLLYTASFDVPSFQPILTAPFLEGVRVTLFVPVRTLEELSVPD